MSLDAQKVAKLRRIISIAEQIIETSPKPKRGRPASGNGADKKRLRRTGKVLVQFRNMLKAERKKGVPVAALARKHGVSSAYIYMLP
jgi:hypothetical protein